MQKTLNIKQYGNSEIFRNPWMFNCTRLSLITFTVRRNLGDSQTFALKRELLVLRYEDNLIEPGQIK